jgi:mannose-1-phosphate guanylyltransferase
VSRFAAILSGGIGERFWPASTPERPKQLLPFLGRRTLLRSTFERVLPLFAPERVFVVTSSALKEAVAAECPELPPENILPEPCARNTALAAGLAARLAVMREGEDASLALLPADHIMRDEAGFRGLLAAALRLVEAESWIVTLGVVPDRPETGYGWITRGEELLGGGFQIAAFHEKPDASRAEELLREGKSYWNAGIFVAGAGTILDELELHAPEIGSRLRSLPEEAADLAPEVWSRALAEVYESAPAVSFDHAVMERTTLGVVLPLDVGWDDVGSWEALARLLERDPQGNVVHGAARLAHACDNIVFADGGRVTVIGASNLLVVRTGRETFVCAREKLSEIKGLLREMGDGER